MNYPMFVWIVQSSHCVYELRERDQWKQGIKLLSFTYEAQAIIVRMSPGKVYDIPIFHPL